MANTIEDLGKAVKAKYPGQYDDMPDAALGQKVKAKYPGSYDDYADAPAATQPTTPDRVTGQFGVEHPVLAAPIDFLQGVGAGAMSTIVHGGDLIRRGLGMERIINKPEVQQLINPPDSNAAKAGKFLEQTAEFMAPAGAVSKATKGMGLLARIGAEGLTAGGVSALQSGGDPGATAAGTVAGAAGPAVGAAAGAAGKAIAGSRIPQKLYQSALKPTWSMVKNDGLTMLDTGIKNEIPVSADGLAMVESKIKDLQKQITDGVVNRSKLGATVDTQKVLPALDDLKKFYANTPAPGGTVQVGVNQKTGVPIMQTLKGPLQTIEDLEQQFKQFHGQKLSLDQAQQLKINTYQLIKDSYGELASAKVEGLKRIALGLKDQISSVFPEISGLNEQQSKLLDLHDALYRALWRIENHQLMGIGSAGAASAGGALMGGPGALAAFAGKFMLDDPGIKSRLAISLSQAGVRNAPAVVSTRLAALKAAMEEAASRAGSREQPSGQLIPAPAQ